MDDIDKLIKKKQIDRKKLNINKLLSIKPFFCNDEEIINATSNAEIREIVHRNRKESKPNEYE